MRPLLALTLLLLAAPLAAPLAAQSKPEAAKPKPAAQSPDQPPQADPARPTITNPAHIPPVAYLQFEQGFLQANDSPGLDSQSSINQTTKLSVTRHILLQLATQPYAHTRSSTGPADDQGDVIPGIEYQFYNRDDDPDTHAHPLVSALAVAFNQRVRTGTSPDLDVGSFSRGLLFLVDGTFLGISYQTNLLLNEQISAPVRRAQFGQTLALSRTIHGPLSANLEIFHLTQPFVTTTRAGAPSPRSNAVGLLLNAGYNLRPWLVLDAGVERGLTSTSTAWQGEAGFTYLIPHRLWHPRN